MKKVAIMLSTYNGDAYLLQQIDSLLHQNGVDISIYIRDDGSKDSTRTLLSQVEQEYSNVHVELGENVGYAKSFWSFLSKELDAEYFAFCDQDDIWDENKLSAAVHFLENQEIDIPLLYTSKVRSVNSEGEVLSENCFNTNGVLSKYESFQRSIIPGCVFVFNRKAKELLSCYEGYMESHDWAAYAIISSFGKVVYDQRSFINYRIHENNVIGKASRVKEIETRLLRLTKQSKHTRSSFAKDFYDCYGSKIEDGDFKRSIYQLGNYRGDLHTKISLISNPNFKGFIFKLYVLINRV